MIGVIIALVAIIPVLGLVTFVQVLYLESLRLRTRDLPSLRFFKETLEDRIGFKTEDGFLDVSLWAKNLFDKDYFLSLSATQANIGLITGQVGEPRTYGVTLRTRL